MFRIGRHKTGGKEMTVIRIRRGMNGFRYSACDDNGYFVGNFRRLSDIRSHWQLEIKLGRVELIRELKKDPDMSRREATISSIKTVLNAYRR